MSTSKIEICNVALAMLGADSIRSFDENNKRARMADVFFDFTRDYLLAKFDWPFCRKFMKLQAVDAASEKLDVPEGWFPYHLPSDCRTPRELEPPGSKDPWRIMANVLYCKRDPSEGSSVYLYYTTVAYDVSKYSATFNNLLALGLAVKMCPAVTQDKALAAALLEQFGIEQANAWEADANIGNEYRGYDETPDNDSFVYPEGFEIDVYGGS